MWESGQDVSSRFGPQQTGGTIIQHVRPVDLQASLAQGAAILARWANLLARVEPSSDEEGPDFSAEATLWGQIAEEFTLKTRQMWQNGWFRDYDSQAAEWSSQQDAMHLAAVFCGAATPEQVQQLQAALAQAPWHSQHWAPLCWPPVVMTLTGAAAAAEMDEEAATMAYQFIESAYRSIDQRNPDPQDGLAGVTREYHQLRTSGNEQEYVNAGIEGYGWGALSIQLLIRYLLGLREEEPGSVTVLPMFPKELRRAGARYRVAPIQWGAYALEVECLIGEQANYTLNLSCQSADLSTSSPTAPTLWSWEGRWGERRTVQLSSATQGTAAT